MTKMSMMTQSAMAAMIQMMTLVAARLFSNLTHLLRALQASVFFPCHGRYLENNPKAYWQRPQTRGHP